MRRNERDDRVVALALAAPARQHNWTNLEPFAACGECGEVTSHGVRRPDEALVTYCNDCGNEMRIARRAANGAATGHQSYYLSVTTSNPMRRREYLIAASGASLGTTLAGCLGNGDGSSGTLATQVTDQPGDIGDFESCVVTITEIRVKPSEDDEDDTEEPDGTETATAAEGTETTDAEETEMEDDDDDDEDAGEESHDVDDEEADLVELQDGETKLVAEQELETGEYEYMKLIVSDVEATLSGGGEAEVTTPGNAPLKFNQSFEIRSDTRTVFTADFTPVKQGASGSYILKPVADGTQVEYGE